MSVLLIVGIALYAVVAFFATGRAIGFVARNELPKYRLAGWGDWVECLFIGVILGVFWPFCAVVLGVGKLVEVIGRLSVWKTMWRLWTGYEHTPTEIPDDEYSPGRFTMEQYR